MSTKYCPNFFAYECWKVGRDFGPAKPKAHRRHLVCSLANGGFR